MLLAVAIQQSELRVRSRGEVSRVHCILRPFFVAALLALATTTKGLHEFSHQFKYIFEAFMHLFTLML